jgi:hypothetical protein
VTVLRWRDIDNAHEIASNRMLKAARLIEPNAAGKPRENGSAVCESGAQRAYFTRLLSFMPVMMAPSTLPRAGRPKHTTALRSACDKFGMISDHAVPNSRAERFFPA